MEILSQMRRHDILFCRNGKIRISANIVNALDIQPGDQINIDVAAGEYKLFVCRRPLDMIEHARYPATCHQAKKNCRNMVVNCKQLANAILDAANIQGDKAGFFCGNPDPRENYRYIPIITRHPIVL